MRIGNKHVIYIKALLDKKNVNIADLSKIASKSPKTIIKELDELESELKKNNIVLMRKQGKGIWLECDDNRMFELQEEVTRRLNISSSLDSSQRRILSIIAFERISTAELADKLYMSISSINKNINIVSNYLKTYNIEVSTQDKKLYLKGREQNIRKQLFEVANGEIYISDLIAYIKEELIDTNESYMLNDKLREITTALSKLETELNIKIADQSLVELHLHFTIACLRIRNACTVNTYERVRINYSPVNHMDEVVKLYKDMGLACYAINFDMNEIKYLSYVVANHLSTISKGCTRELNDKTLIDTIKDGLNSANYLVNYNLTSDKELLDGLENHLEPALNRLANQIVTNSPFTSQIKNDYEHAYNIAKIIIVELQKKYQISTNIDDEIAQIALHVQASIERFAFDNTQKIKVGIVSSNGQGSPQLIKSKLLKQFKNIETADILSVFEYYSIDVNQYDLVVSTTYLNQVKVPIINITPLISYKDLNKISSFLIQEELNRMKKTNISELCSEELCFYTKCSTKEALIEFLCTELKNAGYVEPEYYPSLIKRELISSTDNNSFAIPHGNPCYVNKTAVVFVVNKTPINWGKHAIDIVILPLISSQDQYNAENLMTSVFSLKVKYDLLEKIKKCDSKDELYKTIRSMNGKF